MEGHIQDPIVEDEARTRARAPVATGSVTNRVYVGNLPWSISWQDLKDHFRQVGNPIHATIFTNETKRSKGCGIVEFETREEALAAIEKLNDTAIGDTGRLIFVREDREDRFAPNKGQAGGAAGAAPPAAGGPSGAPAGGRAPFRRNAPAAGGESVRGRQVFVGNLSYSTSWQDLKDHFRPAGNVVLANVLTMYAGRSKGQGTVLFETAEEAQKAIQLFNETEFAGRKIIVHEDKFAV